MCEIDRGDKDSHSRLRGQLDRAIRRRVPAERLWASGSNGVYVIVTGQAATPFALHVADEAGLRKELDGLLVINAAGGTGAAWGTFSQARLERLMPGLTLI